LSEPCSAEPCLRGRALRVLPALAALYLIPYSTLQVPGVFDGPLDSPGVLQLLAVCLVFAGLALSYDLLFGHTGIMSFGHGLFVTGGMYATTILVNHAGFGLLISAAAGLGIGLAAALALGTVALRVDGIGFAMVTLAFGQAVSLLVVSGSPSLTGGEQGQTPERRRPPGRPVRHPQHREPVLARARVPGALRCGGVVV